ncbi:MAG TPA: hypothetical protein VGU72_00530 [Beijerinckiaceae bacterium]|jgi:hypothetical protein|nr:hypothetical protein [Beijerinckiaceae bacterium]
MAALKRMLSRTAMLGGLAATTVLVGAAAPAQSQVYGYWGYRTYSYPVDPYYDDAPIYAPRYRAPALNMLSPGEIRESLRDDGYRVIGQMQRSGRTYIVVAQDRRGQRFRLVVDGIEGEIVRSARLTTQPRNEARANDYRDAPVAPPPPAMPSAPHVVPGIGPESHTAPQTRPPRAAARPESEGPRMRPGESNPPAARPQGPAQAARPDPARGDSVQPVKPATPVLPQPEAAKPETSQPETKPAAAAPRVVYPGGPVTTAPATSQPPAAASNVPAAPLDAPPAKPATPTPDVPVAPLE